MGSKLVMVLRVRMPERVRADDDPEHDVFGTRGQAEAADGATAHEHAADVGEHEQTEQRPDSAHGTLELRAALFW